ncbi:acyl transferase [Arachidicoccus sp.]|uniref:LuxE/PaaK family acyltransferase n=1 Tax=Arachidicoccus sp. TaxID=1872624 RepID=UPI003D1D9A5F
MIVQKPAIDIFSANAINLENVLSLFQFQYAQNKIYRDWCDALGVEPKSVKVMTDIPFLPISFFKTNKVVCGDFEPELIFESSGTTQTINSKHYIKEAKIYEQSFVKAFEQFYGNIDEYCIVGLLPAYLERKNSSLIKMVHDLMTISGHEKSGFYLYNFEELAQLLADLEHKKQKTLLLGVTFALLDFADQHPLQLKNTIVMDTGGMKGRRKELTRAETHHMLGRSFGVEKIHSEYGMTELLSQAYSKGDGRYKCPPWMKVLVRDETDPLSISDRGKGLLNIVDLANIYSCSFIATEDVGIIEKDYFEVWGRLDNSDIRGCSLLVV